MFVWERYWKANVRTGEQVVLLQAGNILVIYLYFYVPIEKSSGLKVVYSFLILKYNF